MGDLVRLSSADVGYRVVVRHRLPDGRATDVLGELLSWDSSGATVRRGSDGSVVAVARAAVVAARRVPEAPVRPGAEPAVAPPTRAATAAQALALEEVMVDGWRPLEVARLGAWLLRSSEGFTGRGCSALPLGDPGVPLADAVDQVVSFSRERGERPRVAVPGLLRGPLVVAGLDAGALDALLAARGWVIDTPTVVMVASLAGPGGRRAPGDAPGGMDAARSLPAGTSLPPGTALDVAADPDEAWMAAYRYRGQPAPPAARRVLVASTVRAFAAARTGADPGRGVAGSVVAVARGTVSRGWAGITAVEVDRAWRRRGLARALVDALAQWARQAGAHTAYLQVAQANTGAVALYEQAGFTAHHTYAYRVAPDHP